ncbi:phosphatase PAP2 family protein [Streptomyces thermodiastaticus]|uniref:phosphatase PAP2 family protein n=1 Tax=Streptomyces thermodiastaticus TaxID=44061 RepID=UPI00355891BF
MPISPDVDRDDAGEHHRRRAAPAWAEADVSRDTGRGSPAWPVLLAGLPALLFALITWQVTGDGPLLDADRRVSRAVLHPDRLSELLSDLGNVEVAVPVLVLAAGYAAWRGRRAGVPRWWGPPAAAVVPAAVLPAVVVPLKDWTHRGGTPVMPPGDGYFPSGHTATAAVAYGAAALVLLLWVRSHRARGAVVTVWGVLVLAVSYGLVRRGYHWPLDVVAGWCLSAVLLVVLRAVLHALHGRRG